MISRRRILAVAAAPLIQYAPARAQEPLLVLGWDGYLDQPAIDRFKHATGIDVVLDVVGSYDEIFTQLRAGGVHRYSVIAPHHGLIGDLQQRGFIQPLDPNQIPHLAEIDSHFALTDTTVIDGAKYGAALIFDTCPALYNADLLPEPPNNWLALASDLYTGKVGMLDDGFSHFNLWGRAIGAAHPPNLSANEMLATTAILSELKQNRVSHFTPYPADLVAQLANGKAVISTTGWGGLTLLPDRGKANIKVVHLQPGDFSFVQVAGNHGRSATGSRRAPVHQLHALAERAGRAGEPDDAGDCQSRRGADDRPGNQRLHQLRRPGFRDGAVAAARLSTHRRNDRWHRLLPRLGPGVGQSAIAQEHRRSLSRET